MTIQRHEGTFGSIELDVRRRATGTPQAYAQPGRLVRKGSSSKFGSEHPPHRGDGQRLLFRGPAGKSRPRFSSPAESCRWRCRRCRHGDPGTPAYRGHLHLRILPFACLKRRLRTLAHLRHTGSPDPPSISSHRSRPVADSEHSRTMTSDRDPSLTPRRASDPSHVRRGEIGCAWIWASPEPQAGRIMLRG